MSFDFFPPFSLASLHGAWCVASMRCCAFLWRWKPTGAHWNTHYWHSSGPHNNHHCHSYHHQWQNHTLIIIALTINIMAAFQSVHMTTSYLWWSLSSSFLDFSCVFLVSHNVLIAVWTAPPQLALAHVFLASQAQQRNQPQQKSPSLLCVFCLFLFVFVCVFCLFACASQAPQRNLP